MGINWENRILVAVLAAVIVVTMVTMGCQRLFKEAATATPVPSPTLAPSAPTPAGAAAATPTPAVPLTLPQVFTVWQDPKEKAFRLLVPLDWQLTGGTQRVNTDPHFQFEARKDKKRFFLQYPAPVQYILPTAYSTMMGYPEGSLVREYGFEFRILRYYPARQFIANIILAELKGQHPDARILEARDLPEVAKVYKEPLSTEAEAASATITFTEGGIPMKAGYTVITDYVVTGPGTALWTAKVLGAIAPEKDFPEVAELFAMALAAMRIDPAWFEAQIQGSAERQAMIRATFKRILDMQYRMFMEETKSMVRIGEGWIGALQVSPWGDESGGPPEYLPPPPFGSTGWGRDSGGNFVPTGGFILPGVTPLTRQ